MPKPRVALYIDHGCRGAGTVRWAELLSSSPEFDLAMLNAADIKAGRLMDFDLLVMPGGGGFERTADWGEDGCEAIRDFVRSGGKYIGTCAGESVLLNEPRRLRMIPYQRDAVFAHGNLVAQLDLSPRFAELTGVPAGKRSVRYHNGPVGVPTDPIPGCKAEVIATFDCDDPAHDAVAPLRGAPAAFWVEYGKGRMFVFAVHPEVWDPNLDLVRGAFRALLGVAPAFAPKKLAENVKIRREYFEVSMMDRSDNTREVLAAALERTKADDALLVPYIRERIGGPFPLLLTPWTEDAHVDIPTLLREAEYTEAAGVGGMFWPSAGERKDVLESGDYEAGLDALIARSVEKGREFKAKIGAIVSAANLAQGVELARAVEQTAKKHGANLVILARPADDCSDQASILAYYRALAQATTQTILVQTFNGTSPQPSVDTLVQLAREYANFGYVKEESPGLDVNGRMEQLLRHREIKGVFSGWGGKSWVYQGTRIGTCGVISQRAEYAPLFVKIWNRIQAGADASDPELADAYTKYLYMANLGDIFSKYGDDEMRGPHLYVLERLGLFRNRLSRCDGQAVNWEMTDKEKAEVDARLTYIGLLPMH